MADGGFPRPRGRLPIIGDLLTVNLAKPCQGLAKDVVAQGGIVEQRIFDFPVVVVSDPQLVADVNDESAWEKHVGPSLRQLRSVAGDGLFTAYTNEPNWRTAHNVLLAAFSKSAMENYHTAMIEAVGELAISWSLRGGWVDVAAEASRLTTEIIARTAIGHPLSALDDPAEGHSFIEAVKRELRYANRRTDAIPAFDRLFGRRQRRQHLADKAWVRARVADLIAARRAGGVSSSGCDMLDAMITSVDPDSGECLDDANIVNQVLTLLVAGSETSGNAIAFALHYLANNPAVAAAVRAELDDRWPGPGLPSIGYGDVARLRTVRRVVDETLRLWPVAPGFFRRAKVDTAIGGGKYAFRSGEWVFVLLLAAHRDTSTWGPDAAEFRPDRFLPDNLRGLSADRVYKPFGTGVRACLGRQFALHEIILALSIILHQFDLEPERGYQLDVSEALTLKPEGLRLRLSLRNGMHAGG